MSRFFFATLLWLSFAGAAQAEPNDLERCIYGDTGIAIDPRVCEVLRRQANREQAEKQAAQRAALNSSQPPNLDNCTWHTGDAITPMQCEALKRSKAKEEAAARTTQDRMERSRIEFEAFEAEEARKKAARLEEMRQYEAARTAEMAARNRAIDEQHRQMERQANAESAAQAKAVSAKKAACGDDYGRVAVGMTVSRISQCYGAVIKRGELNTARGVVSTYQTRRTMLHVIDGKVVSWSSY